jgi:hypothetical protein
MSSNTISNTFALPIFSRDISYNPVNGLPLPGDVGPPTCNPSTDLDGGNQIILYQETDDEQEELED